MLGDIADVLAPQAASTGQVLLGVGQAVERFSLEEFDPVKAIQLIDLVGAIPGLEDVPLDAARPILDAAMALSGSGSGFGGFGGNVGTVGQLAERIPDLQLEGLVDLSGYSLDAIPGLLDSPIGNFVGWQETVLGGIPGLGQLPLGSFPIPLVNPFGLIGTVDLPLHSVESDRFNTVSGSDREGYAVPCDRQNCAHIELAGPLVQGKQWIQGSEQDVKGGWGVLEFVNNGVEQTGRNPFGDLFKVVVMDVQEAPDRVSLGLLFRFCAKGWWGATIGCSPYFIGPVPFMVLEEKSPIFLGQGGAAPTSPPPVPPPPPRPQPTPQATPAPPESPTPSTSRPAAPIYPGSTGIFQAPLEDYVVTSGFGARVHPVTGQPSFHSGIDLAAPIGTPVGSADGGTVIYAGVSGSLTTGYGRLVAVCHGSVDSSNACTGTVTRYAHLNSIDVQVGQPIAKGQPLGTVGSSGTSTGSHLHYEVRPNASSSDPNGFAIDPSSSLSQN